VAIFFIGCSSKHEVKLDKALDKTITVDRHIQKTEKITIRDENETKILLTASYLNAEESFKDDDNRVNEKFIIGLYRADGMKDTDLISDEQNLTIHIAYPKPTKRDHFTRKELKKRAKGVSRLPIVVQKLSQKDKLLKDMSFINNWSSYYLVEFPHSINKKFYLTYQNKTYGFTIKKIVKSKKSKKTKKDKKVTQEKIIYTKYRLNFSKKGKYL
jgi:hypothetical protein